MLFRSDARLDRVFNRRDHGVLRGAAVLVEDFEDPQADVRRHALELITRQRAAAGDEAGDVRAVTEVVVGAINARAGRLARVVLKGEDARLAVQVRKLRPSAVLGADTRVDDAATTPVPLADDASALLGF